MSGNNSKEIKDIKTISVIREYFKTKIELHLIEISNGEYRYDIRKYKEGDAGYRGISLDEEAARNLYISLGKELEYLPKDISPMKLETIKGKLKSSFALSSEQINRIKIERTSIGINGFLSNINSVINTAEMRKLSITNLNTWLVKKGYLVESKVPKTINKTVRKVTDASLALGITQCIEVDTKNGEVAKEEIKFSPEAQKYVIDHIDEIISS